MRERYVNVRDWVFAKGVCGMATEVVLLMMRKPCREDWKVHIVVNLRLLRFIHRSCPEQKVSDR